jgi:hypothetical protein
VKKPQKRPPTLSERLKRLESIVKKQDRKIKELEKKVEHVLDEDVSAIPNNDKLNRPTQHPE